MSKPTIQEMREQLVNNEVEWVSELVIKNRHSELFDYVYEEIQDQMPDDREMDAHIARRIEPDLFDRFPEEMRLQQELV